MATGTIPKYADGTDTGWQAFKNASAFSGTIYYRRVGFMVTVQGQGLKLANALSTYSVYLGSGVFAAFPPTVQVNIPAGNASRFGQLRIYDNGDIAFFRDGSEWGTNVNLHFSLCYVTGGELPSLE